MIIRWLPGARTDLERIDAFWRRIDPSLSARAAGLILDMAESLAAFPERGRPSRYRPETRELVRRFGAGAFILRYRVMGDAVIVVHVRHSKEQLSGL